MATAVDLRDPVWREDIDDQEATARGGALQQQAFIQRLLYQNAPPDLVKEMVAARDLFAEAMDRLNKLKQYFPPEPR